MFYLKEFLSLDLVCVLLSSSESFQRILLQQLQTESNFVGVVFPQRTAWLLPVRLIDTCADFTRRFNQSIRVSILSLQ